MKPNSNLNQSNSNLIFQKIDHKSQLNKVSEENVFRGSLNAVGIRIQEKERINFIVVT